MNAILVLIETPPHLGGPHQPKQDWQELLASLKASVKTVSGSKMLAENLWQIDTRTNLPFLVELLHGVGQIPLPYSILPLEEGQHWISSTAAKI
ncbi:MAG: hypothetical protein ABSB84_11895 [Verrucomicrobiota bacterium]|jgi:hypothetical protein